MSAASVTPAPAPRPSGYLARPDYRVELLRRSNLFEARIGATILAASRRAILVDEQDHALVAYFPREDIATAALRRVPGRRTHCPFKGDAEYWAAADGRPVAWSYPAPYPEVAAIAGHIAFDPAEVEIVLGSARS